MTRPTLSVEMPCYNHGKYVGRAIEAVISQSRPPDEFVIIDDGSTDDSAEIIESYSRKCKFIRFERNECNMGALFSAGRAIRMCSGDYIYFGSADDYVMPGFFEHGMGMASKHPEAGVIIGQQVILDGEGHEIGLAEVSRWKEPCFATPEAFLNDCLNVEAPSHSLCSATLYKRSALDEIGGLHACMGCWCDTFASQAIALKYGVCYMPRPCAAWRVGPDSFSGSSARNHTLMLDIVARAAHMMRSLEFRDRFPEDYVARWESGYRQIVVNRHMQECHMRSGEYASRFRDGDRSKVWVRALLKGHRFLNDLSTRRSVKKLNAYRGDVSCLD